LQPECSGRNAMSLTAKQEAFCQAIVSGMSQADAYRKAYDAGNMKAETIQKRASELMANGEVAGRVQELRAPVVAELQYDLRAAMVEAEEAFKVAKGKENGGAMVAAVTLRAKLNGLLVERSEVRVSPLDSLEHGELKAIRDAIGTLAAAGGAVPGSPSSTRH
jgi:phage terminase small subunit